MNIQIDAKQPGHPNASKDGWVNNVISNTRDTASIIRSARLFTGVTEWRARDQDDNRLPDIEAQIKSQHDDVLEFRREIERQPKGKTKDALHAVLLMLITNPAQ